MSTPLSQPQAQVQQVTVQVDEVMDDSMRRKLDDLMEVLTTSGKSMLDIGRLNEVVRICDLSSIYVEHAYHIILSQLHKKHAQVRLSAFQVYAHLFEHFHMFRMRAVRELQDCLSLILRHDKVTAKKFPQPKAAADELETVVLEALIRWHEVWCQNQGPSTSRTLPPSQSYPQLDAVWHYVHRVSLLASRLDTMLLDKEVKREIQQRRRQKLWADVLQDLEEYLPTLQESLTGMENTFSLLSAEIDPFELDPRSGTSADAVLDEAKPSVNFVEDLQAGARTENDTEADDAVSLVADSTAEFRLHGYRSRYEMMSSVHQFGPGLVGATVVRPLLQRTEDNAVLFDSLKEFYDSLQNRGLAKLEKWIRVAEECSESQKLQDFRQLRDKVSYLCRQYRIAVGQFSMQHFGSLSEDDEDSDEDFEDVQSKVGQEDFPRSLTLDSSTSGAQTTETTHNSGTITRTSEKAVKRKRKRYPGLTDVSKIDPTTPRSRLLKLVCKPATLDRVADTLTEREMDRNQKRFAHQFNYFYNE